MREKKQGVLQCDGGEITKISTNLSGNCTKRVACLHRNTTVLATVLSLITYRISAKALPS